MLIFVDAKKNFFGSFSFKCDSFLFIETKLHIIAHTEVKKSSNCLSKLIELNFFI